MSKRLKNFSRCFPSYGNYSYIKICFRLNESPGILYEAISQLEDYQMRLNFLHIFIFDKLKVDHILTIIIIIIRV